MTARAAAAALVACLDASIGAQKAPSFQNLDLVDLDVVVTDREGRVVTGLKKEDFDVVILLDDVTMPRESVAAIKAMATIWPCRPDPSTI